MNTCVQYNYAIQICTALLCRVLHGKLAINIMKPVYRPYGAKGLICILLYVIAICFAADYFTKDIAGDVFMSGCLCFYFCFVLFSAVCHCSVKPIWR